jgi:hypothetical protein
MKATRVFAGGAALSIGQEWNAFISLLAEESIVLLVVLRERFIEPALEVNANMADPTTTAPG